MFLLIGLFSFGLNYASAAPPPSLTGQNKITTAPVDTFVLPEVLGAKAFLEDMMVRRYAQDLSTLVDRQEFSMGAQLELIPNEASEENASAKEDYPPDFLLGTLDPEEMLKKYAGPDNKSWAEGFLMDFRIKTVTLSVGLKPDLGEETKKEVDKWLTQRLNTEFGKVGHGSVTFISTIKEKTPVPKTRWEWLNQFQALAGQLALALAILIAVFIWKLLSSRDSIGKGEKIDQSQSAQRALAPAPTQAVAIQAPPTESKTEQDHEEKKSKPQSQTEVAAEAEATAEIKQLSKRVTALLPNLSADSDYIIRSWCQAGEEGKYKLACFAEAAGKTIGKLPIPVDSAEDMAKVFSKMPELTVFEKRKILRKVYWDFQSTINLGAESLEQPFAYLNQMTNTMVDKILIDQNPKMKAVVMLHMPAEARDKFVKSLSLDAKRDLIDSTFQMIEVPANEVKSFDEQLRHQVKASGPGKTFVSIKPLLNKLIEPLTPTEEIKILGGLSGAAIHEFRMTYPSLAFIAKWPDEKLSILFGRAMPEEVVAFLRLRPELKDRVMAISPQMTAEVVSDELGRPDKLSTKDKDVLLGQLSARMKDMVRNQEVNLEEIFANETQSSDTNNVPPSDMPGEPTGGSDAGKAA